MSGEGQEWEFSLVLDGRGLDEARVVDALFEAGCDDATLSQVDGIFYADFIRSGDAAASAILSAIRDVESVEGVTVARVEPEDLVSAAEIAERLGRSRESVRLWIAGARGPGGFPAPISHLRTRTRLWRWVEVVGWVRLMDPAIPEDGAGSFVAALNEALGLRSLYPSLPGQERRAIRDLLPSG